MERTAGRNEKRGVQGEGGERKTRVFLNAVEADAKAGRDQRTRRKRHGL